MNSIHTLPFQGSEGPYLTFPNDFKDFRYWTPLLQQAEPLTNFPQPPFPKIRRQNSLLGPNRIPHARPLMMFPLTSTSASTFDSPNATTSFSSGESTNTSSFSSSSPPNERQVREACVLCARLGITCTPVSEMETGQCGVCYALSAECYYDDNTAPVDGNSHSGLDNGRDLNRREIALANLSAYYTQKRNLHATSFSSYTNNIITTTATTITTTSSHTHPTPNFPSEFPTKLSPSDFIWPRGPPRDMLASIPEAQNTPVYPPGHEGFSAYGFSARSKGAKVVASSEKLMGDGDGDGGGEERTLPHLTSHMIPQNRIFALPNPPLPSSSHQGNRGGDGDNASWSYTGLDGEGQKGDEVLERHDLKLEDPWRRMYSGSATNMRGGGGGGGGERGGRGKNINRPCTMTVRTDGGFGLSSVWPTGLSWYD